MLVLVNFDAFYGANTCKRSMYACFLDRCVVPPITVSTPILEYGRCFLHHPYELPVHLLNESDLPAKYELLSQVHVHLHMIYLYLYSKLVWCIGSIKLYVKCGLELSSPQVVEDVTPILYSSPEPKVRWEGRKAGYATLWHSIIAA